MSEVTINYKDTAIATMDASGTKTLQTRGRYCEDDIEVVYARPSAPSGTKQISITQNGTTIEDVAAYANAEITVNVQGGGDGGDTLTKIMLSIGTRAFKQLTLPEKIIFPSVTNVELEALNRITGCKILVLPAVTTIGNFITSDSSFEVIDFGPNIPSFGAWLFSGDSNLSTLIIRNSSVVTLANINVFNNTPFATGKAGGTLYVPQALVSQYTQATNWSTILGYANNQILPIEGSIYETQYADGTPIA